MPAPVITSLQNERIKLIRALQGSSKARRTENRIALEGPRLIADALVSGSAPDFALYTAEASETGKPGGALLESLHGRGVECIEVVPEILAQISDTETPQGVIAVFKLPHLEVPEPVRLALILDGIADPGNMGTLLRSAAAAEVDVVIVAPHCVDPFNPKVLRGAMGAHFRVPLRRLDWEDIAEHYGKYPVYLAEADGEQPYFAVDWTQPAVLIIGGEAHGAQEQAAKLSQRVIHIPMAPGAESLNAAIAASVILFEARRQRLTAAT